MKTQEANNGKPSQKGSPIPHCGDFQKMAEMMKTFSPGEGDAIDCCSFMMRMMGRDKGEETEETRETQEPPTGDEKS